MPASDWKSPNYKKKELMKEIMELDEKIEMGPPTPAKIVNNMLDLSIGLPQLGGSMPYLEHLADYINEKIAMAWMQDNNMRKMEKRKLERELAKMLPQEDTP